MKFPCFDVGKRFSVRKFLQQLFESVSNMLYVAFRLWNTPSLQRRRMSDACLYQAALQSEVSRRLSLPDLLIPSPAQGKLIAVKTLMT
ncbi:protein of unknown function [Burkholderia multivorans]